MIIEMVFCGVILLLMGLVSHFFLREKKERTAGLAVQRAKLLTHRLEENSTGQGKKPINDWMGR